MQKVAEAAGVSKSSVSLALRDDPRIALATRRRIQAVAGKLGYRKNPVVATLMAQLRVSHTPKFQANLGLINCLPERNFLERAACREYRAGICERIERAGYGVEDIWAGEPGLKVARLIQILQTRNIRGLILVGCDQQKPFFPENPEFFREFYVATVGMDRTLPLLPRAATDHFRSARSAVETCIRLGYRRPALFVSDSADKLSDRRYSSGFLAGITDGSIEAGDRIAPLFSDAPNKSLFLKWIETNKPDVVVTDRSEAMVWLDESGLSVPDDMGLLHLDWSPSQAGWAGMRPNGRMVGAAAADLVIGQINNNELGIPAHPRLVLIESDFVPGPSVKGGGAGAVELDEFRSMPVRQSVAGLG